MGVVFAAILIFWFTLTGIRTAGAIVNPLGVAGSNNALLLVILLLVASGTYWVGAKRFSGRFTSAASRTKTGNEEEALEALKRRYVAGEIDEAAFERQLEALFKTETVEDAKRRVESTATSVEQPPESNSEPTVERGSVQPTTHPVRRKKTRSRHGHCK